MTQMMANIRVALRGLRALAALLYNVGPFDVASLPSSRLLSLRWLSDDRAQPQRLNL